MELNYKEIIGILTIGMVFWGYGKYIIDIFLGKTKPHVYSWIVFLIMASLSFLIQYNDGAGPGAWAVGASSITTLIIAILSLFYGTKNITVSDTISFILALISIVVYIQISNPMYALVLVIIITGLAFYPTFRKSYFSPGEETLIAYILAGVRTFISIFAIYNFSILTLAYPIFIVLVNASLVILIISRRNRED